MKIEKAIQVLKNMSTNSQGDIICGKCVFPENKNCLFESKDCQLLAVETVLKEYEKQ